MAVAPGGDSAACGTVLDTDSVLLMSRLDRRFTYFAQVEPRIAEALLIPFHVCGQAVGTIWVIAHDQTLLFDAEDARVLTTLGEFAASAYQALSGTLAMKSIMATIREPLLMLDNTLRVQMASRGVVTIAARSLGLARTTLHARMRKLGISRDFAADRQTLSDRRKQSEPGRCAIARRETFQNPWVASATRQKFPPQKEASLLH